MSSLLGLAAAVLSSPLALAAQDWPHWRGPNFDDSTSGGGVFDKPFELRVRWRAEVGSGYAGIAVLGKTAVTQGARDGSDEVVALDSASGAVRWRHRLGPAFAGQDGAENGPCATPTLHGDEVYAFAPRGELVALTLAEGKLRWKVDLVARHGAKMPHWGFTSAPLVSGELVIVAAGGEGATLVGLERATGATRWAVGNDAVHYPSPILARIGGEELVVFGGNSFLFGIEPASGAVRWRVAHGASEFFQQILQPLVLGEGDFLLENKRLSAARMVLAGSGPGAELETLWNSRHLSSNYNLTVAHDGLLFGHDGELLVCLDAESGELLWRSRPPGDGWVVGVDGWLVLLSKAGGLHCAPAVAEGYEERASLRLFERLCWTPPSFAHGAVFARDSSGAAACVEITPARERPTPAAAARRAPPALFAALEREVAAADDPADVVDEFLAAQGSFPIVEGERTAHFVWRGEAQDVELVGDVLGDTEKHALERVPGTDLFWASFELEPDARVGYQFVKDLQQTLVDPRNERRSFSSTLGGEVSELWMPRASAPRPLAAARTGTLESFTLELPLSNREGRTWGGPRKIDVHLPPGYATGTGRHPVLLVNDGKTALGALDFAGVLDALAGTSTEPMIAVFIELQSAYEFARGERDLYRDFVVENLLPEIDRRYRTRTDAASRALIGFDEGAYAALFTALTRPEAVGKAASVSLFHGSSQGQRELEGLIAAAKTLPFVCLDWGRYDARDATREFSTVAACEGLVRALEARRAPVRVFRSNDGDQCAFWKSRLPALLEALFPLAK